MVAALRALRGRRFGDLGIETPQLHAYLRLGLEYAEVDAAVTGGPEVALPDRHGFGSMLIQQNLSRSLESDVDLRFEKDGLRCRIMIPRAHLHSLVPEPASEARGT